MAFVGDSLLLVLQFATASTFPRSAIEISLEEILIFHYSCWIAGGRLLFAALFLFLFVIMYFAHYLWYALQTSKLLFVRMYLGKVAQPWPLNMPRSLRGSATASCGGPDLHFLLLAFRVRGNSLQRLLPRDHGRSSSS